MKPKQETPPGIWLDKPRQPRRRRPRDSYMTPGLYLRRGARALRILRGRP